MAVLAASIYAPSAFAADRLLSAMVNCKPEFFKVLQARRGSFAPVRIVPYERSSNTPHIRRYDDVFVESVTFARPINVGGLSVLEYRQEETVRDDGPSDIRWQFEVAASPSDVAELLITQYGAPLEAGYRDWVVDPEKTREKSGVSGSLRIEPSEVGARISCSLDGAEAGDFKLPVAAESFGWPQLGPPPLINPNLLMNALAQCRPDFFERLVFDRKAFGTVKFKQENGPYPKGRDHASPLTRVEFQTPVRAWGLELTGYIQRLQMVNGAPSLRWGFQAKENARNLIHVVGLRTGSWGEPQSWRVDDDAEATGYTPSPDLGIDEGFVGCTTPLFAGEEPPKSVDLFWNKDTGSAQ
ncbi:hypothetical protein [Sinorhizobium sp. GL28]|uniref:hypothetical protein n=1 Tax=Sinorhizobium sp. GL28 TaxID=1358418 RepID=UPI0012E3A1DE|nr:hypothetical protein [Sinorhizobium sp. GL28]